MLIIEMLIIEKILLDSYRLVLQFFPSPFATNTYQSGIKMDNIQIGIRFIGMKPSDIRATELAKIITAFEDMIASTVNRNRQEIPKKELGIGLVFIDEKSVGLKFSTKLPELTIPAYNEITKSISSDKFLQLSSETLKHLREIHNFVKARNSEAEMLIHNGKITVNAILFPKIEIPEHPKIKTQIVIYAKIIRVGGSKPHVTIELPSENSLTCQVKDEALARKIGQRLYTFAGLQGNATLDSDNLDVLEFRVEKLNDYEGRLSLKDTIAQLSSMSGKYYADVNDVEAYVESLRD